MKGSGHSHPFRNPLASPAFALLVLLLVLPLMQSCESSKKPDHVKVVVLEGDAYQRGYAHGKALSSRIRSLYTNLLPNSLLPYLNRERPDIASVLNEYKNDEEQGNMINRDKFATEEAYQAAVEEAQSVETVYEKYIRECKAERPESEHRDKCCFSYMMMLQSAEFMLDPVDAKGNPLENMGIPEDVQQEMHGIADGSSVPFQDILVLNTFLDTMLAFRAITFFIKLIQAPTILEASIPGVPVSVIKLVPDTPTDDDDDDDDNLSDGDLDGDDTSDGDELSDGDEESNEEEILDGDEQDELLANKLREDANDEETTDDPIYQPRAYARWVEVPTDAEIHFLMEDLKLPIGTDKGDEPGVDPCTIRIQLNTTQFVVGGSQANGHQCAVDESCAEDDACIQDDHSILTERRDNPEDEENPHLMVVFKPEGGFPEASVVNLIVQAGDFNRIVNPPPIHARFMRDERITFSTKGYGKKAYEIPSVGEEDGRSQPPSISFAVRGDATPDGNVLHAHHYGLLDSNTTHKHTTVFIHKPDNGNPYVILGYPGITWGFSGMNTEGLVASFNNSDSLDSPMVGSFANNFLAATLISTGVPVGMMVRESLRQASDTDEALEYVDSVGKTFGWNMQFTDKRGSMVAVEMDSNINQDEDRGLFAYSPDPSVAENLDPYGRLFSSVEEDDLRMASHYAKNLFDLEQRIIFFNVQPQRFWTSFYFRSLRAYYLLGDLIQERYGSIDVDTAIEILRTPEIVDERDSMMAVIFEPQKGLLHYAMGEVPATDEPFITLDLTATVQSGEVQP